MHSGRSRRRQQRRKLTKHRSPPGGLYAVKRCFPRLSLFLEQPRPGVAEGKDPPLSCVRETPS